MPEANPHAQTFLQTRRSVPAKTLTTPVPDRAALEPLLVAAARVPDHGKMEPWRFIVIEADAMARLATLAEARATAAGLEPDRITKARGQFDTGRLAVVVVGRPDPSEKVPEVEQILSTGAVCVSLLNAALAAGWGANWLTGWAAHDRGFVETGLGLGPKEFVAGIIHIGTAQTLPSERPRPDVAALTQWISE